MSDPSRRRSGCRARGASLLALALTLALGACNYTFQGGGGFPPHIRTLYIAPLDVDPDLTRVDLRQDLYNLLLERVPRALGVQSASEQNAGAVLRVRITRYDDVAQNYRQDPTGARPLEVVANQVEIAVAAEIVDVRENLILWDNRSVLGKGQYLRDSQSEEEGQRLAMEEVVRLIIDGAQSQW